MRTLRYGRRDDVFAQGGDRAVQPIWSWLRPDPESLADDCGYGKRWFVQYSSLDRASRQGRVLRAFWTLTGGQTNGATDAVKEVAYLPYPIDKAGVRNIGASLSLVYRNVAQAIITRKGAAIGSGVIHATVSVTTGSISGSRG